MGSMRGETSLHGILLLQHHFVTWFQKEALLIKSKNTT